MDKVLLVREATSLVLVIQFSSYVSQCRVPSQVFPAGQLRVGRLTARRLRGSAASKSSHVAHRGRRADRTYSDANLEKSADKEQHGGDFIIWGTEVRSEVGRAGAPRARRRLLVEICFTWRPCLPWSRDY